MPSVKSNTKFDSFFIVKAFSVFCSVALLASYLFMVGCSAVQSASSTSSHPSAAPARVSNALEENMRYNLPRATVVSVEDSRSLSVRLDEGSNIRVRLIGVDYPVQDGVTTEEAERAATEFIKTVVHEGDNVWLESDEAVLDADGTPLRYVWLHDPDATDITYECGSLESDLIYYGYATVEDTPPNTKHSDVLHKLATTVAPNDTPIPPGPYKAQR